MLEKFLKILNLLLMIFFIISCNTKNDLEDKGILENRREKIIFWHSMGGVNGEALEKLVSDYNSMQDKVEIEAVFQGNYDEAWTKFKSVSGTTEEPNILMSYDIATRALIDSNQMTPIQEFIDKDKFDTSKILKNAVNYYSYDGKLYSMPFSTSVAVLYYNKDAFKEVGLSEAPKSYAQVREYSKKLLKKEGNNTIRYGMGFSLDPWKHVEQMLGNNDLLYVDKDNGRTGTAEKIMFTRGEAIKIFEFPHETIKDGTAIGLNDKELIPSFISGKITIMIGSSGSLGTILKDADFEVGVAYLPNINGEHVASLIGGNSLWITNTSSESEKNSAWDFIKFLLSKEIQAYWSVKTGYLPLNTESVNEEIYIKTLEERPQLKVGLDQLNSSKLDYATTGASLGAMPQIRQLVSQYLEKIYHNSEPLSKVLSDLESEANKQIEHYNKINKN